MDQPTPQQRAAIEAFVAAWSSGEHISRDHPLVRALERSGVNDIRASVGVLSLSSAGVANHPLNFWDAACDRISFFSNGVLVGEESRRR